MKVEQHIFESVVMPTMLESEQVLPMFQGSRRTVVRFHVLPTDRLFNNKSQNINSFVDVGIERNSDFMFGFEHILSVSTEKKGQHSLPSKLEWN